jgi:Sigma-70, region 4
MANERLSMRKTREILRLKWELGRSHRDVAASLGVGLGTVSQALERANAAVLSWPAVAAMSEPELDRQLYGGRKSRAATGRSLTSSTSTPSFAAPG